MLNFNISTFVSFSRAISLLFIVLMFSACTAGDKLKQFDKKVGEVFFEEENELSSTTMKRAEEKAEEWKEKMEDIDWQDLSLRQKEKIDAWLEENGYNRYGDQEGVMYTGGTPLFDEKTGETKDRYQYILERLPGILSNIN